MSNSLGRLFVITSFGESHGECVGIIVDGCPAGLPLSVDDIQPEIERRKPRNRYETSRIEEDRVEIFSGVFNGHTTGAPIGLIVRNQDVDSTAYEKIKASFRPGHADLTSYVKYGGFGDYRGGGRFSGRITAGFVMAGAVAKKLLRIRDIEILAHTVEIGGIQAEEKDIDSIRETASRDSLRCADKSASVKMLKLLDTVRKDGDSVGGIVEGIGLNIPAGLGEPVFDTLDGALAKSMLAIPAVKGVEFGAGFGAAKLKGSQNNDPLIIKEDKIETLTNNAGGILGGISNGMPLVLRVAVKPTPSIAKKQETVNVEHLQPESLEIKGRHDVCIVPRVVSVVEAMMAVTICDYALRAGLIGKILL